MACYNSITGVPYGETTGFAPIAAYYCSYEMYPTYTCACTSTTTAGNDDDSPTVCYAYNGQSSCDAVLDTYPKLLTASLAFSVVLGILCLLYAVIGCICVCNYSGKPTLRSNDPSATIGITIVNPISATVVNNSPPISKS